MADRPVNIIFSADDFGFHPEITKGIIYAFNHGILRATSIMINQPHTIEAVKLAYLHPKLNVGIHLNITEGKPLTNAETLVTTKGEFHSKKY